MPAPAITAPPPPAPVPPAQQPGILSRLLQSISSVYSDPNDAALLGMASGFGAAGAPHMLTPVSAGQAMSMANQGAQQYRQQMVGANIQQEAALPLQVAKTQQAVGALNHPLPMPTPAQLREMAKTPQGQAYLSKLSTQLQILNNVFGGHNAQAGELEAGLKGAVTPIGKATGESFHSSLGAATGAAPGMHGALPEGTHTGPGGALVQTPGAPGAIASNAYNQAGGAAAATLPYQLAQHYVTRAPGTAGGTLGPMPGPFTPVQAPNLGLGAAPNARAMQHLIGLQTGLTNAAQAAGRQGPMPVVPGVGPSGGFPQRTPEGVAPPGSLAAERAAGAQNLPAVAAQMKAAQAAGVPAPVAPRPILTLPPGRGAQPAPPPQAGGIFSNGSTVAGYQLQKQAADQTLAQESAAGKEAEAAQAQLARLTEMQQALGKMPFGGNVAKVYGTIGEALNYFNVKLPGLTAMQEYTKYRTNFVADAARKMGAKVSYQEVGYIAKGVPDFTLAGNAPRALLAQLQGASQYDIARNQALAYYANHVPNVYGKQYQGTTRGFEQWWQKSGVTPGMFMYLNTALALPDAQRAQYIRHFQRTATGKMFLKQYSKGQAFIDQNRGLVPFWSGQP